MSSDHLWQVYLEPELRTAVLSVAPRHWYMCHGDELVLFNEWLWIAVDVYERMGIPVPFEDFWNEINAIVEDEK